MRKTVGDARTDRGFGSEWKFVRPRNKQLLNVLFGDSTFYKRFDAAIHQSAHDAVVPAGANDRDFQAFSIDDSGFESLHVNKVVPVARIRLDLCRRVALCVSHFGRRSWNFCKVSRKNFLENGAT